MNSQLRKALGTVVLLAYLAGYIAAAAMGFDLIAQAPWWAHLAYFAVAGVVWVAPLKPLFAWMNGADPNRGRR